MRISPEGRRSVAMPWSFAISWAEPPAERTICAPRPGWSSMLWTMVPTGMLPSGRQLPTDGSTRSPETTVGPTCRRAGAMM